MGVIGAFIWLLNRHDNKLKEVTDNFTKALDNVVTKSEASVDKMTRAVEELKADNARRDERSFQMTEKTVVAIEKVTQGVQELRREVATVETIKTDIQSLKAAVDSIMRSLPVVPHVKPGNKP